MSVAAVGIQLNGPLELTFRGRPIPLVPMVLDGKNDMRLGIGFVQRDGLLGEVSRFGRRFSGSYKPVVLINVVPRQGTISLSIVWIQCDGLVEIVDAFVEAIFS